MLNHDRLTTIVSNLKNDVELAEQLRSQGEVEQISALFDKWVETAGTEVLSLILEDWEAQERDYFSDTELLAVGLLGLGRILLNATARAGQEGRQSGPEVKQVADKVSQMLKVLRLSRRAPFTLHGAINWTLEYATDLAKVLEVFDETEAEVLEIYADAISKGEGFLAKSMVALDHPYIPKDQVTPENQPIFIGQRDAVGTLSALAVAYARRGRLTHNLNDVVQAIRSIRKANHYELNAGREKVIAQWTVKAGLDPQMKGKLSQRTQALFLGTRSLLARR
jgi:hypothetical protein